MADEIFDPSPALGDFDQATGDFLALGRYSSQDPALLDLRRKKDWWTIREHLVHVCQAEANAWLRLMGLVCQSGAKAFVVDEEAWIRSLPGGTGGMGELKLWLDFFANSRSLERNCLVGLAMAGGCPLDSHLVHPAAGRLDLPTWLEWYGADHIRTHMAMVGRNLQAEGDLPDWWQAHWPTPDTP